MHYIFFLQKTNLSQVGIGDYIQGHTLERPTEDSVEEVSVYEQYGEDILATLRASEAIEMAKPLNLNHHPEITFEMRIGLIKWLLAVGVYLNAETVHRAVSYFDRFASDVRISEDNFPLAGVTALFIAAKVEEVTRFRLDEAVAICGNKYTRDQFTTMEQSMLKYLNYSLHEATTVDFVNAFLVGLNCKPEVKTVCNYLVDLALTEGGRYLGFLPSRIAAAAIVLASINLQVPYWTEKHKEITGYDLMQLRKPILWLFHAHMEKPANTIVLSPMNESVSIYEFFSEEIEWNFKYLWANQLPIE